MIVSLALTLFFLLLTILFINNHARYFSWVWVASFLFIPKQACMVGNLKFYLGCLIVLTLFAFIRGPLAYLRKNQYIGVILFFITYTVALAFFAPEEPFLAQIKFLVKKVFEIFFLGVLVSFYVKTPKSVSRFVTLTYQFLIVMGIYGIFEYVIRSNPFISIMSQTFREGIATGSSFSEESRGVLSSRISGFTNHPLNWGQIHLLLVSFLPLFRKYISNKTFYIVVVLSSINVLFSGSRSALVPLAIYWLGYFYLANKANFIRLMGYCIILSLFIFVGATFLNSEAMDTIKAYIFFWDDELRKNAGIAGSSLQMRLDQMDNAIYFIGKTSVFCGFGYGFVSNMPDDHYLREFLLGFESIVLKLLVEQGVLGLIFYFSMFAFLAQKTAKYIRDVFAKKMFYLATISFICSLVFTGDRGTFSLYFVLIAVVCQMYKVSVKKLKLAERAEIKVTQDKQIPIEQPNFS